MKPRQIRDRVHWMGVVDWDRRLFDSLIPLPDGTSYNAYLVQGSEKTALLDTVDPATTDVLMAQLTDIPRLDYIVAHHAEQDHSGSIPAILAKYPDAKVVATPKGKELLMDLLFVPDEKFITVQDGETLSLGDKTLRFIHTPWVHWPETMVSYLPEDRILFSCDFFGSHVATTEMYVTDEAHVQESAKRYFAEIMMPFRAVIAKNLDKVGGLDVDLIAPSHGPIYDKPAHIQDAYREWVSGEPKNIAVVAYVSMHGSTRKMVDFLVGALAERGVKVEQFDLTATDIGKLAMSLVDAGTLVVGTPTVLTGPHPAAVYAAYLANAIRARAKFATVIGSYSWGTKAVETIAGLIPNLKAEVLPPVYCKGQPKDADFEALRALADTIAAKHQELGLK